MATQHPPKVIYYGNPSRRPNLYDHATNLAITKARLQEALGTPHPMPDLYDPTPYMVPMERPVAPLVTLHLHKAATARVEAYLLSGIAVGALVAYAGLVVWACLEWLL